MIRQQSAKEGNSWYKAKELELSPETEGARAQIALSMLLRGGDAAAGLAEIALEPDADARSWSLAMAARLTGHHEAGDQWLAAKGGSGAAPDDLYSAAQLRAMRG